MADRPWLSEVQWAVIEPLLPNLGGKPRVDDRRVISAILRRYREGLRWRAIPAEYRSRTTLFNRFSRWSAKGICQSLLAALAACDDPPEIAMVDSTAVRAQPSVAGAGGSGMWGRPQRCLRRGGSRPACAALISYPTDSAGGRPGSPATRAELTPIPSGA